MQTKHYKYDSKIKSVRFNRRIAPKSWTGRNFKKGGWYGKNKQRGNYKTLQRDK